MSYNRVVYLSSEVAQACYNRGVRKSETALVLDTPNAASNRHSHGRTAMAISDSTTPTARIPQLPSNMYDDKHRLSANMAVNRAVTNERLPHVSMLRCSVCNAPAQSYHHESYDKSQWLDVVPMCASCHRMLHIYGPDNLANVIADYLFARIDVLRKPLRRWKTVPLSDAAAAELADLEARYEFICEAFNV